MKLHAITVSIRCSAAAMGLELAGLDYELVFHPFTELKEKIGHLNPSARVPTLETADGALAETHAILRHAARTSGKLYGANAFQSAQVDQWLDWVNAELQTLAPQFLYQLYGFDMGLSYEKSGLFRAKSEFGKRLKFVNAHLEGKEWLVGSEMSMADVALLNASFHYLSFFAGDKERKGLKNLVAWVERWTANATFKKWYGSFRPTKQAYTWHKTEAGAPAKKPQQKKQKKAAPKPKAPAKPKYQFPESKFTGKDLFNFKSFFVNEKDLDAACAKFWESYDPAGWQIYHLKYIKYPGECEVLFRTSNLLNGFLSRTQHIAKHIFGTHFIAGDEPNLVIEGLWLIQGKEIFPDLKEHDQFETYEWIPLDHTNAEHKALAESFLKARNVDEDKVNGHTVRQFKWVK